MKIQYSYHLKHQAGLREAAINTIVVTMCGQTYYVVWVANAGIIPLVMPWSECSYTLSNLPTVEKYT